MGPPESSSSSPPRTSNGPRLRMLDSRRRQIRGTLRAAEFVRNRRLAWGWVPGVDGDGKDDGGGRTAVAFAAFALAFGAIALRIGGRAALVSMVGLDFLSDNPELRDGVDAVLDAAVGVDDGTKIALFLLAWTAVKVSCIDAGGVALALASGILFGGVAQGAIASAASATFGSAVAFALARLDTPVRRRALDVLEEYPSLRGIERVVARDGFKAILTLRLAPVLPIPLGMYNYVYGVTNVRLVDLCGGIFLGSLKPYFLDSYLGYFGKTLLDGGADGNGAATLQDFLLLGVLGISVLVGVFASQLAGETWDSVLEEVEAEKRAREGSESGRDEDDENEGLTTELFGRSLPTWAVQAQAAYRDADRRVGDLIVEEYRAGVWNYTRAEGGIPADLDPARFPGSREREGAHRGIDLGASFCEDLALSPRMLECFVRYADPLYDEANDPVLLERADREARALESTKRVLLERLDALRANATERIDMLERYVKDDR